MLGKSPVHIVKLNHSALNVQALLLSHCNYLNQSGINHRKPSDLMDDIPVKVCLQGDRKSTRLNSSHVSISYAVFCLKKKINTKTNTAYTTSNAMHPCR